MLIMLMLITKALKPRGKEHNSRVRFRSNQLYSAGATASGS